MLMVKNKQTSTVTPSITLHRLIGQLTYLGASARLLLIATLALAVYGAQILEAALSGYAINGAVLGGIQSLFYVIGTFFVLEVGYLLIAKTYKMVSGFDKLVLFGADILLAAIYFTPYLVYLSPAKAGLSQFIIVPALAVLAGRLLIGLLYGSTARR